MLHLWWKQQLSLVFWRTRCGLTNFLFILAVFSRVLVRDSIFSQRERTFLLGGSVVIFVWA